VGIEIVIHVNDFCSWQAKGVQKTASIYNIGDGNTQGHGVGIVQANGNY
jgi:hypothetical protein